MPRGRCVDNIMETKKQFVKPCLKVIDLSSEDGFMQNTSNPGGNMSGGSDEVKGQFFLWGNFGNDKKTQSNAWEDEEDF